MTVTLLVSMAVLLRIFSNPFANVFQKQLTGNGIHPLIVNFLTYFLLSIGCLLIAAFNEWPVLSQQFWVYSVLGGAVGALGNGFLIKALQKGELSIMGPVNSYKSVIGLIGGIILLREVPEMWGILGIILIICGSYFVLDTTEERFSLSLLKRRDIQFRLAAMVLTAIEAVFVKKVILASSMSIAFISWCFSGAVFSFVMLFFNGLEIKEEIKNISLSDAGMFSILILCIGTMQFTTNFTFAYMNLGYALSLFQLSTIVSVVLGHKFFKELAIRKKIIGSLIMVVGSIVIILMQNG